MPSPEQTAVGPRTNGREARTRRREELVYQAMTVGAIVAVLATVWVF